MPYVGCTGDLEDRSCECDRPCAECFPDDEERARLTAEAELAEEHECCSAEDTPTGAERWECDQGDPPWVCPVGIAHFGYTQDDIVMLLNEDGLTGAHHATQGATWTCPECEYEVGNGNDHAEACTYAENRAEKGPTE